MEAISELSSYITGREGTVITITVIILTVVTAFGSFTQVAIFYNQGHISEFIIGIASVVGIAFFDSEINSCTTEKDVVE